MQPSSENTLSSHQTGRSALQEESGVEASETNSGRESEEIVERALLAALNLCMGLSHLAAILASS